MEKALAEEYDLLKERTLGIQLFKRDPSYDTSEDAIVRVTASDVRRRLAQFYGSSRKQPDIRIDLPSGSYVVQFTQPAPLAPVESPRVTLSRALVSEAEVAKAKWRFPGHLLLILASAVVLIIGAWIGYRRISPSLSPANCAPWAAILRANRPLKLIFSDPNMASLQQAMGYQLSLADYASKRYIPAGYVLPPEATRVLSVFRGNTVAAVDATTALRISGIVPSSRIQTFRARTLQAGDFKTEDNFVIMGSPMSNPWLGLFQEQLDFEFRYDAGGKEEVIWNKRPSSGESSIYAPTVPGWGTGQAYAIAAFLANPNQSGHIMIVAGSNAAATEATGKFITNAELVASTLTAHGLNPFDEQLQFEMLLRVNTVATSLNTFDVVACRRLSSATVHSN